MVLNTKTKKRYEYLGNLVFFRLLRFMFFISSIRSGESKTARYCLIQHGPSTTEDKVLSWREETANFIWKVTAYWNNQEKMAGSMRPCWNWLRTTHYFYKHAKPSGLEADFHAG